ncbi:MAG TPA: DUF3617 family protein [Acidobacteriaceae bacterium]|nr:DUF3617 family protein [Acidobacteriaceae bacterium]
MRTAKTIAVMFSLLLLLCAAPARAVEPALSFHPGNWEIESITTQSGGRTITSQTSLCAKEQIDFWKVAQAGLTCKTPKSHPEPGNKIRIKVHCEFNGEKLHSDIHSEVVETLSDHGNSFTLEGTTTTHTVYQGVQPKHTSVQLHATAHRTGECK